MRAAAVGNHQIRRTTDRRSAGMVFTKPCFLVAKVFDRLDQLQVALEGERRIVAHHVVRSDEHTKAHGLNLRPRSCSRKGRVTSSGEQTQNCRFQRKRAILRLLAEHLVQRSGPPGHCASRAPCR